MEVHAHSHTARKKWTHYFWKNNTSLAQRRKRERKYMLIHPKEEMEGETEILR